MGLSGDDLESEWVHAATNGGLVEAYSDLVLLSLGGSILELVGAILVIGSADLNINGALDSTMDIQAT